MATATLRWNAVAVENPAGISAVARGSERRTRVLNSAPLTRRPVLRREATEIVRASKDLCRQAT
eukprot:1856077-Lingulodinium_polyedra.AAC.1